MAKGYIYRTSWSTSREYIGHGLDWVSKTSEAQVFDEITYNESYSAYKFEPIDEFPLDTLPTQADLPPFGNRLVDDGTAWGYNPLNDELL